LRSGALEIAPQDPAVQDTLGWIYYRRGLYPAAAQYLQAAVAKVPNPARQFHLALSYIKAGAGAGTDAERAPPASHAECVNQRVVDGRRVPKSRDLWIGFRTALS
jgi:hypothetical protein